MSDDYIRLIPTDASWQPGAEGAAAATTYVGGLFGGVGDRADEIVSTYYDAVTFIDAGENTSRAWCPACGSEIDLDWMFGILGEWYPQLADLDCTAPCCGAVVSLNELKYDWPMGFARFEITVLNGSRATYRLDAEELERVGVLLGHPVRQVLAHY